MKMLATKTALAVTLAALLFTEAAHAQRHRAAPRSDPARSYAAPGSYGGGYSGAGGSRFTPEEQRIIDSITANDWKSGK
jgi:hypothetical protein